MMYSFLTENSAAPGFSASTYDGEAVALSGLIADGPVVLSFLRSLS
jgi:peroxiredoxin